MQLVQSGRSARLFGLLVVGACASAASAHLGSFGPNEGYTISQYTGPNNWVDVSYYNAGQYGPASGGGSFNALAPNAGLWKLQSANGAFFPNAALRNAQVGTAPPYTGAPLVGSVPSYIVGAHFNGRNNDGYNLAVRNDNPAGTGPIVYDYSLDTYDTGGPVAASQSTGVVKYQTYFLSDPDAPPSSDGSFHEKFTMSFMDSAGNIGAQWGYSRDNQVGWRDGPSSAWIWTTWNAGPPDWNGIRVSLDLSADTFALDYYDEPSNTWNNLTPSGTPMGTAMTNFTTIRWQLEDAVNLGIGGKNFFDDSSFGGFVPAPGSAGLVVGGLLVASRRRRR
ncbi:MAG: hypothetical protein U0637_04350 [Phycisphaerales bacterium]